MIIERIQIGCFGRLERFSVDLAPTFNLIEGGNEAGKSTLAAFIRYMLYGFAEQGEEGFSEREHRVSRTEGKAEGSLFIKTADGRYRIDRSTERTANGWIDRCVTTDLDSGEQDDSARTPGERFLGVPCSVYDDTALFVRPTDGAVHGVAMAQAIENLLFSGSEKMNTSGAVEKLTNMREQIVSVSGRGGALSVLEAERQALIRRLQKAREDADALLEKENLLYDTKRKKKDACAELEKFERLQADYHNAVTIRAYDRLHEAESEAEERTKKFEAFKAERQVNGLIPDAAYLAELAGAHHTWREAGKKEKAAKNALAAAVSAPMPADEMEELYIRCVDEGGGAYAIREKNRLLRSNILRNTVLLGVLAFLFVLGMVGMIFGLASTGNVALVCFAAAVALFGLGGAGMSYFERQRCVRERALLYVACEAGNEQELEKNIQTAQAASARLSERFKLLENAQHDAETAAEVLAFAFDALATVAAKWGYPLSQDHAEEDVEKLVCDAKTCMQEYDELLFAKQTVDAEVRALRAELAGQSEIAVRALVAPVDRAKLCNLNEGDLQRGVEHYRHMSLEFAQKEEMLEKELAGLALGESPAALAEELAILDARIASLRERAEAYALAAAAVTQTTAQLKAEVSPRLSSYACQMLDEMTDGKYTDMQIGADMKLTFTDIGGATYPAQALSSGTMEMTYLALRMALSDLMYRELPPFLFDECMAFQDDTRATALMRAIAVLTEEGKQCVLLSCHEREAELAKKVFVTPHTIRM